MAQEKINFGIFELSIDNQDKGGTYYKEPKFWADLISPISKSIIKICKPTIFLDIGANYGFTSLIHSKNNPHCKIIAVEASPKLIPFLQENLQNNGCSNFEIINAVCSDENDTKTKFSLNPNGSQDNRVIGFENWSQVEVNSITIDSLLNLTTSNDFISIKIDVQGSEEKVFKGGQSWLQNNSNWIIKTEFAPDWLRSQNTDPINILKYLARNYVIAEVPNRSRFKGDNLKRIIRQSLKPRDCGAFVDYIQALAKKNGVGIGWCDLIVLPSSTAEQILNPQKNS